MSRTFRLDPIDMKRKRPGRGYWQYKRLDPAGDTVLPNGKLVDKCCDHPWTPRTKRLIKRLTARLARRRLNKIVFD